VSFSIVQNGNCSISGNVVTLLNVGNCGVIANQSGNSAYSAAPAVGQIVVVNNPAAQTITFAAPGSKASGTTVALTATASSGLSVSFSSSTTSVCTVSGSTATLLAAGTCTIVASQPGNSVYSAATPVTQSFTVTATLKSQVITFNAIPAQILGRRLTLSATASSGLAVSFSIVQNGTCSISGNVVTFTNIGTCGVTANQAGNSVYAAAPAVKQNIVVNF
jgi:ribosomal protein S11